MSAGVVCLRCQAPVKSDQTPLPHIVHEADLLRFQLLELLIIHVHVAHNKYVTTLHSQLVVESHSQALQTVMVLVGQSVNILEPVNETQQ